MRNARRRPRSADEDGSTFLRLRERSSTNFLRDSRDLFPRVDGGHGIAVPDVAGMPGTREA